MIALVSAAPLRIRRLLLTVAAAALTAAGCGGGDSPLCPGNECPDASPALDSATGPDAAVTLGPEQRALFLWQGYDHEWLRTVLGFRVPHRISQFDSYIADEAHLGSGDGDSGEWTAAGDFHFGQATGVDGNYMKPLGYHGGAYAPGLHVERGELHLTWTDEIADVDVGGNLYPRAESTRQETMEIDLGRPSLGYGGLEQYEVALAGMALQTSCDDAQQPAGEPCNSDGMWPYRFAVAIETCAVTDQTLSCPLTVEMHRAWTPNRGGLPGIEEKPLNKRLNFDLRVYYVALGGDGDRVGLHRGATVSGTGLGRDDDPFSARASIAGTGGDRFPRAAVALQRIGFTLSPANGNANQNHLGRYIGGWRARVHTTSYDPATGIAEVEHLSQLWVPDTVAQTAVDYETGALLIQVPGDGDAHGGRSVEGSLCSNSSDQAPPFSTWERCGEPDQGPEQTHDTRAVTLP